MVAPQPSLDPWQHCLHRLGGDIPQQQFNTWIRPLQARWEDSGLVLAAPNRFIRDFVAEKYSSVINAYLLDVAAPASAQVSVIVAGAAADQSVTSARPKAPPALRAATPTSTLSTETASRPAPSGCFLRLTWLKATRLSVLSKAKAISLHWLPLNRWLSTLASPITPYFFMGGVGLGKTHLMHAVGNAMRRQNPDAKIVYLHSERFVADMVKALQLNAINDFKRFYRSVDALLIDDIQFFANKDRSQEEFFHTFNALLEGGQQMILTCDRYPKEIDGVEERLKSRFGWGLTVAVEPPDLETRVAILMKKAEQSHISLEHEAAFFIAQRIRSNVRELEGR